MSVEVLYQFKSMSTTGPVDTRVTKVLRVVKCSGGCGSSGGEEGCPVSEVLYNTSLREGRVNTGRRKHRGVSGGK